LIGTRESFAFAAPNVLLNTVLCSQFFCRTRRPSRSVREVAGQIISAFARS
jgi:hypothetical protein